MAQTDRHTEVGLMCHTSNAHHTPTTFQLLLTCWALVPWGCCLGGAATVFGISSAATGPNGTPLPMLEDCSSNGTFLNHRKLTKGESGGLLVAAGVVTQPSTVIG
jgi:hypothetical protein